MNKINKTIRPGTKKMAHPKHRVGLIISDFIFFNLGFLIAGRIIYGRIGSTELYTTHLPLFLVVNLAWLLITTQSKAYDWLGKVRMELRLNKLVKMIFFHFNVVVFFYYVILRSLPDLWFFLLAYLLVVVMMVASRICIHYYEKKKGHALTRYVVVGGDQKNLADLIDAFSFAFNGNAQLVGRFGDTQYKEVQNIGSYKDLKPYLQQWPTIDQIVFFHSKLSVKEEQEILKIAEAQFIRAFVASRAAALFPRGYVGRQRGDMLIMGLREEPLMRLRNRFTKRIFDLIVSGAVMLFLLPIMYIVIGFLIKRESPGPILFKQQRSGYGNEVFDIWKFRSLRVNDNSDTVQVTKNDDRRTKIGDFLRRTSLDEFPQFFNVFLGNMSIVGPRPHMLKHTEEYAALIDHYMIRHKIKPGITGWAQVNNLRGSTEELWKMQKRVDYDVRYLENWSLLLDLRCVWRTVFDVLVGEEAAN
jgi:putative colanic acid biosynthesis UDP-glucose lipid carrier transferase